MTRRGWAFAAGATAVAVAAAWSSAHGQPRRLPGDSTLAPGVVWRQVADPAGPWVINVVWVDLRGGRYELRHVRAMDSLVAREKVSAMVARQPEGARRVPVAINADFFNVRTGENEGNQVIAGEWWKGVRGTNSPYDAFDNVHTQFGVDARGRPLLDRFVLEGTVLRHGDAFPVFAVNFLPRGGPEVAVIYTDRIRNTPRDTVRPLVEWPLDLVARRGDTAVYVLAGPMAKAGGNAIPTGGVVLAAYGPRSTRVASYAVGDTVRVVLRAAGASGAGAPVSPLVLIGGWPRILQGGRNVAARAPWTEGTISSNAEARHPRSAVGFSADSSRLILMTVDGRQAASVGATLVELADLMKRFGAWDALNFDGGGSTALIVRGAVVNKVSDAAGERPVGNALLVVARDVPPR